MTHKDNFATKAIHSGSSADPNTGAVIPPISLSTTYKQDSIGVHKVCCESESFPTHFWADIRCFRGSNTLALPTQTETTLKRFSPPLKSAAKRLSHFPQVLQQQPLRLSGRPCQRMKEERELPRMSQRIDARIS